MNQGLRLLLSDPASIFFGCSIRIASCRGGQPRRSSLPPATVTSHFSADGPFTTSVPTKIQTDGGQVSRTTARCTSLHAGLRPLTTAMPDAASLDYITGASVVATRGFIAEAGLMPEDYFLYYEEVEWAFRRGARALRVSPDVVVYHRGGTAIGSGDTTRRPSPFANYFNYRNRMRFLRRCMPRAAPGAVCFALAKAAQLGLAGATDEARAIIAGTFGLPPPGEVRARITDPGGAGAGVRRSDVRTRFRSPRGHRNGRSSVEDDDDRTDDRAVGPAMSPQSIVGAVRRA